MICSSKLPFIIWNYIFLYEVLFFFVRFRRMADIVDQQDVHVKQIEQSTETSHQAAQAGLEQVKQAAAYQPTCNIS